VIYVHLFEDNFHDNLFFSIRIGQKQWRDKKEERGKEHLVRHSSLYLSNIMLSVT